MLVPVDLPFFFFFRCEKNDSLNHVFAKHHHRSSPIDSKEWEGKVIIIIKKSAVFACQCFPSSSRGKKRKS
jgi:hypothetical protein